MSCEAQSQQPRAWRTAAHWNRLLTVTPRAEGSPPGSASRLFLSMNERVRGEKRAPTESAESPAQSRRRLRNDRCDTRTDHAGAGRPPPSACTPTSGAVWMESCGWWRGPKNAEPGAQPHGWSGNLREVEPEGDVLRNYF